ncbi:MAG TPA: DUF1501 domain-containing protein [Rubricoccaceae bacterium]|jgi:uncharacterized protein (DUF1501 family)
MSHHAHPHGHSHDDHGHGHSEHGATPDDEARAVALEHGAAHDADHATWTRRDFLARAGLGTAAIGLGSVLGTTRASALTGGGLLSHLSRIDTDRVLVLIQLKGGNDGLNTVIPVGNSLYHNARPTLGIADTAALRLADGVGLHPSMAPLMAMWSGGDVAVVHSVGYPAPSLSHFDGTDTWSTARPVGQSQPAGGWAGRTLRLDHPVGEPLPDTPPAVQIGSQNPLLFQSGDTDFSLMLQSAATIAQIQANGGLYDPDDVPVLPYGAELSYARTVSNAANRYVGAVQTAASAGTNAATYPNTTLGNNLAAVAKLVRGGLTSRVFVVQLGSFDTHVGQATTHATLLGDLAGSVASFYADLAAAGHAQRVLTMTFSEFGRRVGQNGSGGTDHGTAAPLFAFGPSVTGGLYGTAPDLSALTSAGNLVHSTDFRSAYATVLGPWFGLDAATVAGVLGGAYAPVGFAAGQATSTAPAPTAELRLDAPFPNPVRDRARLRYALPEAGPARLLAYDALGRTVAVLDDGFHAAGAHEATFDASVLPAGVYVLRLETAGATRTVRATVVR